MSLAQLETRDDLPTLSEDPTLLVREVGDIGELAKVTNRSVEEVARRWADGHRAYVAYQEGVPASFGWVATRTATMGELGAVLRLTSEERYLWNFVTLAPFRGRRIYPRLLRQIIAAESRRGAERFWIAYAPENHASATGIRKAGFTHVADLSFDPEGNAAVRPLVPDVGPRVSALLGVRETAEPLTPCWKCVRAGRGAMHCAEGSCECDYQRPAIECTGTHDA